MLSWMWSHGLSWNYFLVCIFVLDISDFRYRGVKMCLFEALMRVSKFIKKILSCSEDTNKMQAEFARERESAHSPPTLEFSHILTENLYHISINGVRKTVFHQHSCQINAHRNTSYLVALLYSFRLETSSKAHPIGASTTNLDYRHISKYFSLTST